jgi:RNA polymerase sigma-32 factor
VAQDLGVSPDVVLEMESRLSGQDVSFDPQPQSDDDDDGNGMAPATYLQDAHSDPAEVLERQDWQERASSHLPFALKRLDPRSRDILQRRWLAENKPTLHELADEYNVSAERIRQLENNAIKKLRTHLPVRV